MPKIVKKKTCPNCNGTKILMNQWKKCEKCNGYGMVRTATDAFITGVIDLFIADYANQHVYNQKICPDCKGEKGSFGVPCPCKTGYIQVIEDI
jgi:DnaJ-class molecular chaperone